MLRHLGLIAVCACIVASVGCDGGKLPAPSPPMVTVEFGGRVVNADAGGPVGNVRVSLNSWGSRGRSTAGFNDWNVTATSGGDGTFTLPLNLPMDWASVNFQLSAPPGYDHRYQGFERTTAADRPAIRMYPTLVIGPGESIEMRVDSGINLCSSAVFAVDCRRVLVAASPGDSVELEVVPHDSSKPIALGLAVPGYPGILEPDDMSVRRLTVPPGGVPYVLGAGTATLTARR